MDSIFEKFPTETKKETQKIELLEEDLSSVIKDTEEYVDVKSKIHSITGNESSPDLSKLSVRDQENISLVLVELNNVYRKKMKEAMNIAENLGRNEVLGDTEEGLKQSTTEEDRKRELLELIRRELHAQEFTQKEAGPGEDKIG